MVPEGSLFNGKFKKAELLKPFGITPFEDTGRTLQDVKKELLDVSASRQSLTIDTNKKEVFPF